MSNQTLTDEYLSIIEALHGDLPGREAAQRYMESSTAVVHDEVVESSFIPKIFDGQSRAALAAAATTLYGILCKVIACYQEDESYRRLFRFDERLADLLLAPRGYSSVLPIARVDLFLDEESGAARFCEINTDGTSGMNENREVTNSLRETASFAAFAARHDVEECELFRSWVRTFIRICRDHTPELDDPLIAICDYLDHTTLSELLVYRDAFEEAGFRCELVDIRDLSYADGLLADKEGRRLDAVWKRCTARDVLDHWEESAALVAAAREGRLPMIGSFAGTIAHDKQLFAVLHHEQTRRLLTDEEAAFVEQAIPQTFFLSSDDRRTEDVIAEKDGWIVKPNDLYGAQLIYAGRDYPPEEWEGIVRRCAKAEEGQEFLAQRYIKPFRSPIIPLANDGTPTPDDDGIEAVRWWNNLTGVYLYDGEMQGVFSRLGPNAVIGGNATAASLFVDAPRPRPAHDGCRG